MHVQQEPFHSLQWMHRLRATEIEPELRALGYSMMAFADARGELFPTVAQLALMTPAVEGRTASESTIKRRRRELVRLGWVRLVEKGDGRGKASVYALSFPGETGSETGSRALRETGSGVTHQERHQVRSTLSLREREVLSGSHNDPPSESEKFSVGGSIGDQGQVHTTTTDSDLSLRIRPASEFLSETLTTTQSTNNSPLADTSTPTVENDLPPWVDREKEQATSAYLADHLAAHNCYPDAWFSGWTTEDIREAHGALSVTQA